MYSEEGPRTNNNLEGWHSKVKKIVRKIHLNIFDIVELFKKEQASTEDKHHVEEKYIILTTTPS